MYIYGLHERISRNRLELHLERSVVDCIVSDIGYGLDPAIALVTFKERLGKFMFLLDLNTSKVSWLLQAMVIICISSRQRNIGIIQFRKKNFLSNVWLC